MRFLLRLFLVVLVLVLLAVGAGAAALVYVLQPELEKYEPQVLALKDRQGVGHGWQFHSRIYSQALIVQPELKMSRDQFIEQLETRGYQERLPEKERSTKAKTKTSSPPNPPLLEVMAPLPFDAPLRPGEFRKGKTGLEVAFRGFDLPGTQASPAMARLRFAEGRLRMMEPLTETPLPSVVAIEPMLLAELLGDNPRRSTFVLLQKIPKHVQDAVISSEDSRFEQHAGIDYRGVLRAVLRNVEAGQLRQGGSTITQQLARTLFLSTERTWRRKVAEVAIALQLGKHLSKDMQLELYLNSVYLGQLEGVGIHGVQEAARAYFGKSVGELSLGEAATLSGVIPAPNAFSPLKYPERAQERRALVLSLMRAQGRISAEEEEIARQEQLRIQPEKTQPLRYGYYTGYVREFLKRTLGEGFEQRGLTVYAAMDPVVQNQFESSLIKHLDMIERRTGKQKEPLMGAAMLIDPHTGQVIAIAGGRGYDKNPFNRAFQSRRQPGSSFKPIAYATALEGGEGIPPFTPGTTIPDERRTFIVKEGEWKPRNYESDYHEKVTLAKALTKSLNVATVNLVDQVGPEKVAAMAKRLGLGDPKPVLSIGLGTNEVTLEQMVRAYATFPSGGLEVIPQPDEKVVDLWGHEVYKPSVPSKRLLKEDTATLMVDLLRSVVIYGTSWTLRTEGWFPKPSAGKTGTSQDEQDAWYMGFTQELLMGVWVGYDTPKHLYGSAADIAVPVWGSIMSDMNGDAPAREFELPPGFEYVWIDPYTGGRSTSYCLRPMRVAFKKGTAPKESCPKTHEDELLLEENMGEGGGTEGTAEDEGAKPEGEAPRQALPPLENP
ncbi:MAG: PBP1A family penicillin-binding protein [Myxococcota bacterium]